MAKNTNPYYLPARLSKDLDENNPDGIRSKIMSIVTAGIDADALALLEAGSSWAHDLLTSDAPASGGAKRVRQMKAAIFRLENALLEQARLRAVAADGEYNRIQYLGADLAKAISEPLAIEHPNGKQRHGVICALRDLAEMENAQRALVRKHGPKHKRKKRGKGKAVRKDAATTTARVANEPAPAAEPVSI